MLPENTTEASLSGLSALRSLSRYSVTAAQNSSRTLSTISARVLSEDLSRLRMTERV